MKEFIRSQWVSGKPHVQRPHLSLSQQALISHPNSHFFPIKIFEQRDHEFPRQPGKLAKFAGCDPSCFLQREMELLPDVCNRFRSIEEVAGLV